MKVWLLPIVWIAHLVVLKHALCAEMMKVVGSAAAAISTLNCSILRRISGGRTVGVVVGGVVDVSPLFERGACVGVGACGGAGTGAAAGDAGVGSSPYACT